MRSTPRHRRSSIATHIGALLLCALWPAAVGAAGAEAEVAAVQDVLPQLPLPAAAGSLSLEGRISRIEGYLPLLATKEDLRNTEKSLRAEMKADLQATETRLEKAIETKLEIAIANLRAEFSKEMREQLLAFLGVNGGLAAALGTILLLVMRSMLQLSKEVRQQNGHHKGAGRKGAGTPADEQALTKG